MGADVVDRSKLDAETVKVRLLTPFLGWKDSAVFISPRYPTSMYDCQRRALKTRLSSSSPVDTHAQLSPAKALGEYDHHRTMFYVCIKRGIEQNKDFQFSHATLSSRLLPRLFFLP